MQSLFYKVFHLNILYYVSIIFDVFLNMKMFLPGKNHFLVLLNFND